MKTQTIDSGIKLKSWQKDAYEWYINNQSGGILVVNACRQVGKSTTIGLIALKASLENSNSDTFIISPTLNQSRHIFKTLSDYIKDIPCYESINKQLLVIEFKNGSTINFKSSEQQDALRGFTCRGKGLLICDEAAFLKEDTFSLILPYTNVNNNSIIYTSTPLFKRGWFWDMYNSIDDNVTVIDTSNYDLSMFITEKQKEFYKSKMPNTKYLREIEGLFIDMIGSVFSDFSDCVRTTEYTGQDVVFGIDWSTNKGQDDTAVAINTIKNEVIDIVSWNDIDETETINKICELAKIYKPKRILVELNSIGNIYYGLLKKELSRQGLHTILKGFNTTNDSKHKMVSKLQVLIQNKQIKLPNIPKLLIQLSAYEMKPSATNKPTYNAPIGQHDDVLFALMLSVEANSSGQITII